MSGIVPVIRPHDLSGRDGHLMRSPISPVDPALRTIDEDARVLSRGSCHAHIGVRHGVAAPQPFCQGAVADVASKTAVSGACETFVPIRLGHPYFDPDIGV